MTIWKVLPQTPWLCRVPCSYLLWNYRRVMRKPAGHFFLKKLHLFIFNWLMIALQYWFDFCHTSTWISDRYSWSHPMGFQAVEVVPKVNGRLEKTPLCFNQKCFLKKSVRGSCLKKETWLCNFWKTLVFLTFRLAIGYFVPASVLDALLVFIDLMLTADCEVNIELPSPIEIEFENQM